MGILIHWLMLAVAIILVAYLLPGVRVTSFTTALMAGAVLGLANALIKPILVFLTLPITIVTLSLFALVLNALI